jgi:hypothetical protein
VRFTLAQFEDYLHQHTEGKGVFQGQRIAHVASMEPEWRRPEAFRMPRAVAHLHRTSCLWRFTS